MNIFEESLFLHRELGGKFSIQSKKAILDRHDLSLLYTPGVARPCEVIAADRSKAYELTIKKNTVAVVTDGSAVLGLGNIGPEASLPVMEGKAILFKEYAGVDAFPICLATQKTEEIIQIVKAISPGFAGINLEDISAPRCFEIEQALQDIGIPVFHDDQHGTSITLLAALLNACKLAGKPFSSLKIVINGAGAAGQAIAELLLGVGYESALPEPVASVLVCDTKGVLSSGREDIAPGSAKYQLAELTNPKRFSGGLADALAGADVFVGVSAGKVVTQDMVRKMGDKPMVFAMANPIPEIMPEDAQAAGAFIVGTGRSDFPNQVNNVLIFPGIFRGAIDVRAQRITPKMKVAAAFVLSSMVASPSVTEVLPSVLNKSVAFTVARAVSEAAEA